MASTRVDRALQVLAVILGALVLWFGFLVMNQQQSADPLAKKGRSAKPGKQVKRPHYWAKGVAAADGEGQPTPP
jgi:hypothetical protein